MRTSRQHARSVSPALANGRTVGDTGAGVSEAEKAQIKAVLDRAEATKRKEENRVG